MRRALGPLVLGATCFVAACASPPPLTTTETEAPGPAATATVCANVESRLVALHLSPDPNVFAREQGMEIDGVAVRVIVELFPGYPLPPLPAIIERRDNLMVQALVTPDRLCEVAEQPGVRTVRTAFQPQPLRSGLGWSEAR